MATSAEFVPAQVVNSQRVTEVRPRLVTQSLMAVFGVIFGAMMNFYLLLSVVPVFARSVGASATAVGFATGAMMLSTVLAEFGTPAVLARFGYRRVIAAGLLLLGLPAFAMISAHSVEWVLAMCIVRGIGVAILVVLGGAMVVSTVPAERRGEGLGLYGFVAGVPAVIGLPLGLWLAQHAGYPTVFSVGGVFALAGLAVVRWLPGQRAAPAEPVGIVALIRVPELVRISILFAVTTMAAGVVVTFLPLAQEHASANFVALALLVQAASSTVARWWAGGFGDRHGSQRLLIPSVLVAATGILALVSTTSPAMTMTGMVLFGCGFGVAQNASLTVMFDRVASAGHDAVSALWNLAYDAGLGIGAAGFGIVASRTGYSGSFGLLAALMCVALLLVGINRAAAQTPPTTSCRSTPVTNTNGHYAKVNGLDMYYETHGAGADASRPVVLLHGALNTIETSFGKVLPELACHRRIVAIEQQAHGHTADIARPLTYEQMADDVAELLRQLGIKEADFLGFSMGGVTALVIAVRHPDLVHKLAVVSGLYTNDGYPPETLGFIRSSDPANSDQWAGEFRKEFERKAPIPSQWPAPIARTKHVVVAFDGIPKERMRAIQAPTLFLSGDADVIRLEHTLEMFRLLPHAQLALLPGTGHDTIMNRSGWLLSLLTPFLN